MEAAQGIFKLVPDIASIGADMTQPKEALDDFGQHQWCAVAVLDISGVYHRMNEIVVGCDACVLGFLACILAGRTARLRRFHALAVDNTGTARSFAPNQQQGIVEGKLKSAVTLLIEPEPNCRNRREAGRQHPQESQKTRGRLSLGSGRHQFFASRSIRPALTSMASASNRLVTAQGGWQKGLALGIGI